MAKIYGGIDMTSFDFNHIYTHTYQVNFFDNEFYQSATGTSYSDAFEVMFSDASGDYAGMFFGTGLAVNTELAATAGTINAIEGRYYYDGLWYIGVLIEGFSISAVTLQNAFYTNSRSDDLAIFATILQGADTFDLSDDADTAFGFSGSDTMFARDGNDKLDGGQGSDRLVGGKGKDQLTGGGGADTFDFNSTQESRVSANDIISDFVQGTDRIDLATIDAFAATDSNNSFLWRGTAGFSSASAGEIRYQQANNSGTAYDYTMIYIDTDADADAEMAIRLTGLISLSASDFAL